LYPRDATAILLTELDGLQVEVDVNKKRVGEICKQNGARNITTASEPEKRLKMWKGRKAAFAAAGNMSPDYYVQDGVIPRTKMANVLQEIESLSHKSGYQIANVFHAGDGNLHPLILFDNSIEGALEEVEEVAGEILKICVEVGGSLSGEHGIGSDKKCFMPLMFDEIDLETMQWIRSVFNPKGLANPEKIFPTPRTCGESAMVQKIKEFEGVEVF
ncbi:MAG: FAD-binding oxidoreductase, partial [Okeania sp. SIO2H7]|nr:FAD-binding oxidoreductase [Okeania sp. SIO2H7]